MVDERRCGICTGRRHDGDLRNALELPQPLREVGCRVDTLDEQPPSVLGEERTRRAREVPVGAECRFELGHALHEDRLLGRTDCGRSDEAGCRSAHALDRLRTKGDLFDVDARSQVLGHAP